MYLLDFQNHFNVMSLSAGTSLVVTVIRSIGNNHAHFGAWCWTQTGSTGKASMEHSMAADMLSLRLILFLFRSNVLHVLFLTFMTVN